MRIRTVFICLCAIILAFGIIFKYTTWRDFEYIPEPQVHTYEKTMTIG